MTTVVVKTKVEEDLKKYLPNKYIGAVLLVVVALFALASYYESGEQAAYGGITPPRLGATESSQPMNERESIPWIDGTRPTASAEHTAEFERFVNHQVATLGAPLDTSMPLADAAVLDAIDRARRLIERQESVPFAWRWAAVQEEVRKLGRERGIELRLDSRPIEGTPLSYEIRTNSIRVHNPDWITSHSAEDVSRILVHEVTHRVYRDAVLNSAAFSVDEWAAMSLRCFDIYVSQSVATEAVAFLNEASWVEEVGGAADVPWKAELFSAALAARRHGAGGSHNFAGQMLGYARHSFRRFMIDASRMRLRCGPPVIIHGDRRGEFYLPSQPASELIDPLYGEIAYYHAHVHPFGFPEPEAQ